MRQFNYKLNKNVLKQSNEETKMSEKEHLFTCFPDQVPPGGLHQTTTIPAAYKKVSCSLTLPIGSVSDMHGKGVLTAHKTDFFI